MPENMLETDASLLPMPPRGEKLKVVCAGLEQASLTELGRLLDTLGVEVVATVLCTSRRISPATYIGQGKIEDIKSRIEELGAHAAIIDVDLSPNQLRNLEADVGKPVLDRPGVILEIFSRHARTKEAKTQVSLARLQYLLPRLAHFWSHFERQRGGGTGNRGMGETQIEVDRRLVKKRMSVLRERLVDIENERNVQRSGRKDVFKVALVGYTNAGKSTLLNELTQSKVLAENKLFATLDASVRTLDPHSHPPVVAIDTVGFISRLPHTLVASFRSTLEELREADLLVHVVDASSERAAEEMGVTLEVLKELAVDETPRITVLNKADLLGDSPGARNRARVISPGSVVLSALHPGEVIKLRDQILDHFRKGMDIWEILVPYGESKLESQLYAHGSIEVNRHMAQGTFYRLRMDQSWASKLGLEKYRL